MSGTDVAGGSMVDVRRPADGVVVGSVRFVPESEVREIVRRAREAQSGWGRLPPGERGRLLARLPEVVGGAADEIAETVMDETGKPRTEALVEVLVALELMRHYARHAADIFRPRSVRTRWLRGKRATILREPLGVIGVISPWNYPFLLPMDAVTTALHGGNAVVVKPSEYTPLTALKIEDLARKAGLPEGLVRVIPGDGSTGAALVGGGVDKVALTGSPGTGRRVMAAAAETLTPVALELGGKDPAIVLEDADLDRAARGIAYGAFFNAGQTCVSTERVYVVESVYEAFVHRLTRAVGRLRAGSAGTIDTGPMTTPQQLEIVEEHLEDALEKGARVAVGGHRIDPASNVFQPTVLEGVDESMRVMREETFGPLLPVARVRDVDEAVARANATSFGFFASVWTRDLDHGRAVAARLRCGGVSLNDTLSHWAVPSLPVGGVGWSGFGRSRGEEGLREVTRTRVLFEHRSGRGRDLWWFPYTRRTERLVGALIQARRRGGTRGILAAVRHFLTGGAS